MHFAVLRAETPGKMVNPSKWLGKKGPPPKLTCKKVHPLNHLEKRSAPLNDSVKKFVHPPKLTGKKVHPLNHLEKRSTPAFRYPTNKGVYFAFRSSVRYYFEVAIRDDSLFIQCDKGITGSYDFRQFFESLIKGVVWFSHEIEVANACRFDKTYL